MVHPGRGDAAVVDDLELATEFGGIGGSGLFGEVDEQGPHPGSVLAGRLGDEASEGSFGEGGGECAAAEAGLGEHLGLGVEEGEDPPPWVAVPSTSAISRSVVPLWRACRYASTSPSLLPKRL